MSDGDREAVRDALSVLAHDIRLDIVLALLDGWAGVHTEPQSFSELMDAVGVTDSGKFNYHLDRLRGVYVEKADGGYLPTAGATALYRAVLAHRPTEERTQTDTLSDTCPVCGGTVTERYERSFLTVECTSCEDWPGVTYAFPANGLRGRAGGERLDTMATRASYHIGLARTGQCPFCAGHTQVQFDPPTDWAEDNGSPSVELACDTCSWWVVVGLLAPLQFAPQVVSALTEIGVEPRSTEFHDIETRAERVSEDPVRQALSVATAEGSMRVVVDADLGVQSVEVEH